MDFKTALNTLIVHLPDRLQVNWLDLDLLHDVVKRGGFPRIKKEDIIYPLQTLLQMHPLVWEDHWYGHRYYCIQEPIYKNAKYQQDEVLKSDLRLHPGYFLYPFRDEETLLLKEAITWLKKSDYTKADKTDNDEHS
jgi:hypothetical protein